MKITHMGIVLAKWKIKLNGSGNSRCSLIMKVHIESYSPIGRGTAAFSWKASMTNRFESSIIDRYDIDNSSPVDSINRIDKMILESFGRCKKLHELWEANQPFKINGFELREADLREASRQIQQHLMSDLQ